MNALSDLISEVSFRERMRGYDYEEVDGYVKRARRAAAQAKERIAELEHRVAQLESQAGSDEGVPEIRETLLRTLVLAQRTADAAVAEARSEAKSITDSAKERAAKTVSEAEAAADERLRSAEERAARILAESEENGQVIVAEAKRTAAAELASERAQAQSELRELETAKAELDSVVTEIQARLDSERDMLRSLASSFQSFVETFEPVAELCEPAEEHGPEDIEVVEDATAEAESAGADADPEPLGGPDLHFLPAADEPAADPENAGGEAREADAAGPHTVPEMPAVVWDEAGEHGPPGETVEAFEHESRDEAAAAEPAGSAPDVVPSQPAAVGSAPARGARDDAGNGDEATSAGPATMPFGADTPELFDMDAEEDDEFIEQLRQVVSRDAPLPDTEAAMAAFFDHDEGTRPERPVSAASRGGNPQHPQSGSRLRR